MRALASAFVVASALPLVAACAGGDQGSSERRHIAENFSELVTTALGDSSLQEFDREVLERAERTGRIEQADYDEAFSRFAQCMETAGKPVTLTRLSNGLYRVGNTPLSVGETVESAMSVVTRCSEGTTNRLAELYGIQQGNPELLANPYEIAYNCLESKGLVGNDLPLAEFQNRFRAAGDEESTLEDRMPFDLYSDDAQACFVGANMTIAKAS
jgi:hypothetical protein